MLILKRVSSRKHIQPPEQPPEPMPAPAVEPIPPVPPISPLVLPECQHPNNSAALLQPTNSTGSSQSSISLVSRDSPLSSRTSLPGSIKFAPLPELAPRKRKSSTPLGIAARGAMMRKKRGLVEPPPDVPPQPPVWTPEEIELHYRRQYIASEEARRRAEYEPAPRLGDEEDEEEELGDPFVALGRAVKSAWTKIGKKDKSQPNLEEDQDEDTPGILYIDPEKRAVLSSILSRPTIPTEWDDRLLLDVVQVTQRKEEEDQASSGRSSSASGSESSSLS